MAWNPNVPTVTNRVQDDLNAIRENFQHLDPLAQAVGELQAVSELAPYVQAILSSRIVEHNLDVSSPPSAWYVRLANGLQLVLIPVSVDTTQNATHSFASPVAFKSNTPKFASYSFTSLGGSANRQNAAAVIGVAMSADTTSTFAVATNGTGTSTNYTVHVMIIGFW